MFSVAPFLLGGGGEGGWKAPDSGGGDGWGGFPVKNLVWTMAGGGGGIGPLDPPPVHKNIRHLRGQTAHTTSLIRHQTSDLIHIAGVHNLLMQFFTLDSTKIEVFETCFFDIVIT